MRSVEEHLDELDEIIDNAKKVPMTQKSFIDAAVLSNIVQDIRTDLPSEIRQARSVVANQNAIIADARREAETITRNAEERARAMVDKEDITRRATIKANDIVSQAQTKANEITQNAIQSADKTLRKVEELLSEKLKEVNQIIRNLQDFAKRESASFARSNSQPMQINPDELSEEE